MTKKTSTKHTLTTNEAFVKELVAAYPCANTVSQAILHAAQDGVTLRKTLDSDLEAFIREVVRDELADE